MTDPDLKREMEALVKIYGLDAVRAAVDEYRDPYGHFPEAPPQAKKGAPRIGVGRDVFVFALMELLIAGTGKSVSWCAQQIVKDCEITFYNPQYRGQWISALKDPKTIRRIYYRARKKFGADEEFDNAVGQEAWLLMWWQLNAVDVTWGIGGMVSPPTGLHKDFKVRSAQCASVTAIARAREVFGVKIEKVNLKKLRN